MLDLNQEKYFLANKGHYAGEHSLIKKKGKSNSEKRGKIEQAEGKRGKQNQTSKILDRERSSESW